MSEGLFSTVELSGESRAGYRLHDLEVFNWGTFHEAAWRFTLGGDTALLTGDIGSGKSTLVDAMTTLLIPAGRVAYNRAAGADSRERTLRSYVEGHYKSERIESSGRSRARGLREGARTYSVVLAVFVNEGHGEQVTIAQVFQQREPGKPPHRFYVTAKRALSIEDDFADFGNDLKDLRKRLRGDGAQIFDDFPKYSTELRRLLGVRSPQALELFHQTVSMKSVGNLNDFVRDHMLEPADTDTRVAEIIGHFDNLTKAYEAVKRARDQLEALAPVVESAAKYEDAIDRRAALGRERDAVRLFMAELRAELLAREIAEFEAKIAGLERDRSDAEAATADLTARREALIEERARSGGDRIAELERLIGQARALAETRRASRATFDAAVQRSGFGPVTGKDEFHALLARRPAETNRVATALEETRAQNWAAIAAGEDLKTQVGALKSLIDSLRGRASNLPDDQVQLRDQLCADLGLTANDLPYTGELIDVAEDHAQWRGAAERVLRGFALSLLVPQRHYAAVTSWVNERALTVRRRGGTIGAKLVFERVPERRIATRRQSNAELVLADCLETKEGPFKGYLVDELARRADHLCARTIEEFRQAERAVTREGQVRSRERHEKDDRYAVNDPRRWVLGWANEPKIAAHESDREQLEKDLVVARAREAELDVRLRALQEQRDALRDLDGFERWQDLDAAEAEDQGAECVAERERLLSGSTRLAEIEAELVRLATKAKGLTVQANALTSAIATTLAAADRARQDCSNDLAVISRASQESLAQARAEYDSIRQRLGREVPALADQCESVEAALTEDLHRRIERLSSELNGHSLNLTQHMRTVLERWPELRAELDVDVNARGAFVAFRNQVATDDLPGFEDEFKRQLNTNAIQELAGFSNWLGRQAGQIDDRIRTVNEALSAVPFNPGRFIRLEKELTTNHDVVQFKSDLRALTDDALADADGQYSEQRFLDVRRIIERFRGREGFAEADKRWTKQVTDVRNWFVFAASEREQDGDLEVEHYSDSDGKSGGQKEKLAYTILAASLAYQFGLEWGAAKSKDFRFAVIDEAFGRGSDASTRYALELFAKLGLQLLIVTPLQKVHVIEPYVRAIGFVDNPTGSASRLRTMTIEDYRERQGGSE
ncbi:ATP-binding protein [Rarobacter incanus]|uniref:Uncharacterized protein YPO0396 n=1 Tax=Rarobacter incanus TaxID=153494 RepID=A0A542SN48_9MICO|nr:SbcC/MukB-like Walker B domain-containing protein [Rarobacter incanus]TQK76008.1 uncharacterized protein YPO0396 [Rarobacter incanus]